MATRHITVLTDDLDGGTADRTVEFGLDGVTYTIELSEKNIGELRTILDPYLAAGRRLGRSVGALVGTGQRRRRPTPQVRQSVPQSEPRASAAPTAAEQPTSAAPVHEPELSASAEPTTAKQSESTSPTRTHKRGRNPSPATARKQQNQAIRRWAAENQVDIAARGRIPRTVIQQYRASVTSSAGPKGHRD